MEHSKELEDYELSMLWRKKGALKSRVRSLKSQASDPYNRWFKKGVTKTKI